MQLIFFADVVKGNAFGPFEDVFNFGNFIGRNETIAVKELMSCGQAGKQLDHQIKCFAAHSDHAFIKTGVAQGFLHERMRQELKPFKVGLRRCAKHKVHAHRCVVVIFFNVIGFDKIGQLSLIKNFL